MTSAELEKRAVHSTQAQVCFGHTVTLDRGPRWLGLYYHALSTAVDGHARALQALMPRHTDGSLWRPSYGSAATAGDLSDSRPAMVPGVTQQQRTLRPAGGRSWARQPCCALQPSSAGAVRCCSWCMPSRHQHADPLSACRSPVQAAQPPPDHKVLCDQDCLSQLDSYPSQTLKSGVKTIDIRTGTGASPPVGLQVQYAHAHVHARRTCLLAGYECYADSGELWYGTCAAFMPALTPCAHS